MDLFRPFVHRQQALPVSRLFSFIVFGFLGTMSTYIITYHTLDALHDRFQALRDTEDTFDFIVGSSICVFLYVLCV